MPLITNARFVASFPKWQGGKISPFPEVCFVGRSNVGKSTLINAIVGQKALAKTSSTPGRTQALVVFEAELRDDYGDPMRFHLVDLPGYGFAHVPVSVKASWRPMMEGYFRDNLRLRCCVFLIDARRTPAGEDFELLEMMEQCGVGVLPVATKVDKITKTKRKAELRRLAGALGLEDVADLRAVSVTDRSGIRELVDDLGAVLRS